MKIKNYNLEEEQFDAFIFLSDHVFSRSHDAVRINGPAGTGKTYVLRQLIRYLNLAGISTAVAAYTGRAAKQLSKDGVESQTCHSILYTPICDEHGNLIRWAVKSTEDILTSCGDVLILDEASMIPDEMYSIFEKLPIPKILSGDKDQLPSISMNLPKGHTFNAMEDVPGGVCSLTKNRRFDETNGIGYLANHLRTTNSFPRIKKDALKYIRKSESLTLEHHENNQYSMVICGMNKTRKRINRLIRTARGYHGVLPEVGEQVVCLKNTILTGTTLSNGELFEVMGVFPGEKISSFILKPEGENHTISVRVKNDVWESEDTKSDKTQTDLVPMTYGWCLTTHKCVHPDTIVETPEGLFPIKDIPSEGIIATRNGMMRYENKVVNPSTPSREIVCDDGYSLTVTDDHDMEYFNETTGEWEMKSASDVEIGDQFRLSMREICKVNKFAALNPEDINRGYMDVDHGEFLGLMMNGFFPISGFGMDSEDIEVADRFCYLTNKIFGEAPVRTILEDEEGNSYYSATVESERVREALVGFFPELLTELKELPSIIMRSPVMVQKAFIRGMLENSDVDKEREVIRSAGVCESTAKKIQLILLRMGIVSSIEKSMTGSWQIRLYGSNVEGYMKEIGFISDEKSMWNEDPIRKYGWNALEWHYVRVREITPMMAKSMCVTVPDDGTFLQNGFSHGNCQGSTFSTVLFVDEDVSFFLDQKKFRYTANTRAAHHLTVAL